MNDKRRPLVAEQSIRFTRFQRHLIVDKRLFDRTVFSHFQVFQITRMVSIRMIESVHFVRWIKMAPRRLKRRRLAHPPVRGYECREGRVPSDALQP